MKSSLTLQSLQQTRAKGLDLLRPSQELIDSIDDAIREKVQENPLDRNISVRARDLKKYRQDFILALENPKRCIPLLKVYKHLNVEVKVPHQNDGGPAYLTFCIELEDCE